MVKGIKYTDCSGICGFCEIEDTCTNPKRLKLLKKRASKMFTNPADALIAFRDLVKRYERGEDI